MTKEKSKLSDWESFKEYCEDRLNFNSLLLEELSSEDILDLTARGLSTSTISKVLDIDQRDVEESLYLLSQYRGLTKDLDKNPLLVYNMSNSDIEFLEVIPDSEILEFLKKYIEFRKDIDLYYDNATA